MIFKSKKQIEEEVYKRIADMKFRDETEGKLYRLEEEVSNLRHIINRLEDRLTVPQPQPCIVKASWTGTDPVDYTPYIGAWGGNSMTGGADLIPEDFIF